jgi:hypothetical protein
MKVSHRISRLVAAGLMAGAVAAPAASARPAGPDTPTTGEPVAVESASPAVQGFDWTSAAIGAGVGGGLILLLGVGGTTLRQRQARVTVAP